MPARKVVRSGVPMVLRERIEIWILYPLPVVNANVFRSVLSFVCTTFVPSLQLEQIMNSYSSADLLPTGSDDDHRGIVRRGIEHALNRTGKARPADVVFAVLGEAVEILNAMPDQERSWLSQGKRTTWRPVGGLTKAEVGVIEKGRVLSGIAVGDNSSRPGSGQDVSRSLIALEWAKWLISDRDPGLRKAALLLASGDDRGLAARVWRPNRKYSRTSVHEIRIRAAQAIIRGLKSQFNIDLELMLKRSAIAG